MPRGKKKRPEEKRPIELTDDEALERFFGKDVREELKKIVEKADRNKEKPPHK